jgi:hypothetical protein
MPDRDAEKSPVPDGFAYEDLDLDGRSMTRPFALLAQFLCTVLPAGPCLDEALSRLLESKDAAIRGDAKPGG